MVTEKLNGSQMGLLVLMPIIIQKQALLKLPACPVALTRDHALFHTSSKEPRKNNSLSTKINIYIIFR